MTTTQSDQQHHTISPPAPPPQPPPLQTATVPSTSTTAGAGSTTTTTAANATRSSPTSPHAAADAARAMRHTAGWKPQFDRRVSWNREDQKREVMMRTVTGEGVPMGEGFTERERERAARAGDV